MQVHIWRPTMVTQPIQFGTSACKCTASLVEMSRSNAASPGLVPETSCRPSAGVTHCKPVVAGVAHVAGKSCRQVTLQALAAGVIHIAGRGCEYHTWSSHSLRVPKCEQLLRVLHTVQAQPRVTHALQTWSAGGVPGWGQHTLRSRRLRVSGHPLRAGLRVLHAVQTEVCGWGTLCGQGCKCLKRWTLYGRFPTAEREVRWKLWGLLSWHCQLSQADGVSTSSDIHFVAVTRPAS